MLRKALSQSSFFYYLLSLSCFLNEFNFQTTRAEIKLGLTSGWPLKNRILHYLNFPFLNSITNPSVQPESYGSIYKGSFKGLLFLTCFNKDTCAVTPRNTRQAKMNVFFPFSEQHLPFLFTNSCKVNQINHGVHGCFVAFPQHCGAEWFSSVNIIIQLNISC